MGRRTSLASLAGAKVEDVPGRSDAVLLTLQLEKLHCTRFNPRRNFGTEDELREFGEKLKKEQLQPAVVVSRTAYLKLWPDEAEQVGAASYVIANGERRYRASKLVGLSTIEVVHREDVAASKADFLDAVQSENNDRKDLDPIERAIAIETMVTELGGADQVAAYYGKTKGWVSQQRKLLKLVLELQDLVSSGELPVRVARDIAGLPPAEQAAAWKEELERRRLEKEAAAQLRAQAAKAPQTRVALQATEAASFTAVNHGPAVGGTAPGTAGDLDRFTAVNQQGGGLKLPAAEASPHIPPLPEARRAQDASDAPPPSTDSATGDVEAEEALSISAGAAQGVGEPLRQLPYDNAFYVAQHLHLKMEPAVFSQSTRLMLGILQEQHPNEYRALLQELAQQEEQLA